MRSILLALALAAPSAQIAAHMQSAAQTVETPPLSYADLAGLVEASDLVIDVTVLNATRLKGAQAAGVPAGQQRFYLQGNVTNLVGGKTGIGGQISWLADVPVGPSNQSPRLKKARLLLFARAVPGRMGEVQLTGPYGQRAWTPELAQRARTILAELNAAAAPPRITGVGHAFHVPGSLPGESETQIFLTTADSRPVSLNILRRPGESPRWTVALAEIVDESASAPLPDTLLWYRLACALPPALPDAAIAELDPAAQAATRADYALVVAGLGACTRNQPAG